MSQFVHRHIVVPDSLAGKRLDQALAELFPDYSRTRLKEWILAGLIQLDGEPARPRSRVLGGERVDLYLRPEPLTEPVAQALPLAVAYEDTQLIVIDKPAGFVVHPGAGNPDGTLQNALLHHDPDLGAVPRAGIVHRLDKDTSGLMVVARTLEAHTALVRQLQARTVSRVYEAICVGVLTGGGTIAAPIGRHPRDRLRMAVRDGGRPAVTHYRVIQRFRAHTRVRVVLETGRTHQIRVHLGHHGYPLVGDPLYGGRLRIPAGAGEALAQALRGFGRQALHAVGLEVEHPARGERMSWRSELPEDMRLLLRDLEADAREAPGGD